jgi:hypothetical protein
MFDALGWLDVVGLGGGQRFCLGLPDASSHPPVVAMERHAL